MSGGSGHCVVVWEWQEAQEGWWLPHPPAVTRALERAYAKKLTRVVLADADPALKGHCVNLRTLTQIYDHPDGSCMEYRVRRTCYVTCPRGARWEWAPICQQRRGELAYEPLPIEGQVVVEAALGAGGGAAWRGWWLCARRLTATAGRALRVLRRVHQPPYPLARLPSTDRKPRIPQQHTGSSVHSIQSVQSVQSVQSAQSAQSVQSAQSAQSSSSAQSSRSLPTRQPRHEARSVSPRERKPGLARQILHNLNIFSNNKPACIAPDEDLLTADDQRTTDSECSRGRRHSVDTVSTYLSHESKETDQVCGGSLLDCSAGSDDVFISYPPPAPTPPAGPGALAPPGAPEPPPAPPPPDGTIFGVDGASRAVCGWVRGEARPQWGAVCPACLQPLLAAPAGAALVAFTRCAHMIHLHCLNRQLARLRAAQETLYMECLVCGETYGGHCEDEQDDAAPPAPPAPPAPVGEQPRGSMAWTNQPTSLPGYPPHVGSILVTYSFMSGVQGPQHPAPGSPYYAVGFPRHSLLPDTPLGRQVLAALRRRWAAGRLFCVRASRTTGREHVVCWSTAPPPHAAPHYAGQPADRLLAALLPALRLE